MSVINCLKIVCLRIRVGYNIIRIARMDISRECSLILIIRGRRNDRK